MEKQPRENRNQHGYPYLDDQHPSQRGEFSESDTDSLTDSIVKMEKQPRENRNQHGYPYLDDRYPSQRGEFSESDTDSLTDSIAKKVTSLFQSS